MVYVRIAYYTLPYVSRVFNVTNVRGDYFVKNSLKCNKLSKDVVVAKWVKVIIFAIEKGTSGPVIQNISINLHSLF